jgi:hypothetical protein
MYCRILLFMIVIVALISLTCSKAWGIEADAILPFSPSQRLEVPDDEYMHVPRESMKTSPAYHYSTSEIFTTQVNVNIFGENIVGDAANEPSIAIDPTDLNKIAIGWRQFDTITSNFRQAGYGYTSDGGQTWPFSWVLEPGIFRSDPVLDSDSDGNFYYNSLTVEDDLWCDVFRSTDGGATWDAGTFAQGGDKAWMVIDKSGGIGEGNIYAYWSAASICPPLTFTRSTDGGDSYEDCSAIQNNPYWGTLAVGPEGELYVCGQSGSSFVVVKSTNAQDPGQLVSWDFSKHVDLDGNLSIGGPNSIGLLGQAWIAVDRSTGPTRGNVYLLASVIRNSIPDSCDVMFSRSTDGGVTWSSAVRVNDDPGDNAWQWFGTMSVAPSGRIDVIWLDTRDDPGGYDSALYYSYSTDAGVTWLPNARLSEAFDPHVGWPQNSKIGDYYDMVSDESGVHLSWAATFNEEQDVYYSYINTDVVGVGYNNWETMMPKSFSLSQNYPNPFNPLTTITFDIPGTIGAKQRVSLNVYDIRGRLIRKLVNGEKEPGYYTVHWNGRDKRGGQVGSGIYFYRIETGEFVSTKKMVLLK